MTACAAFLENRRLWPKRDRHKNLKGVIFMNAKIKLSARKRRKLSYNVNL